MIKDFRKIFEPVLKGNENLNAKEIQVCCPFHKDDKPSMSINTETGMWICFGCDAKGDAIEFYMRTRNVDFKTALKDLEIEKEREYNIPPPKPKKEKPTIDYKPYLYKMYDNTFWNSTERYLFYGNKLEELRGINKDTAVVCMISYDPNKGWIFPIIRYPDLNFVGYEVRHKLFQKFANDNKCYKADNTPSCLSVVFQGWTKQKAIICEGFVDSYFMTQYILENYKDAWILTPSNGVHSLPKLLDLLDFEEVVFVLDNDQAGNETSAIIDEYATKHNKNFKFFKGLKEGQDFEDWYKEHNTRHAELVSASH